LLTKDREEHAPDCGDAYGSSDLKNGGNNASR
jgi:hypothetical protein